MEKNFNKDGCFECKHFADFNLAGFTYWSGVFAFDSLKIGSRLRLVREKDNAYDSNAIAIYFKNCKLGYVPRSENEQFIPFIDLGYKDIFDVRINRINPQAHPSNQIGVTVFLVKR